MYRLVRVLSATSAIDPITVMYYVKGAKLVRQYRRLNEMSGGPDDLQPRAMQCPLVFNDAIMLQVPVSVTRTRHYCFLLDVSDNQPTGESVMEKTGKGVIIEVYNENGVMVCNNGLSLPTTQSGATTNGPGEMTSEPIDGSGEMTSVPGEMAGETTPTPGEMTSVPGEEPGEMI